MMTNDHHGKDEARQTKIKLGKKMKLETIFTHSELKQFNKMIQQAHKTGAGSVRLYCPEKRVVLIGIVAAGELMTWFCTPAHTPSEAILSETVVMSGITVIGMAYEAEHQVMAAESADLAAQAIQKAAQCKMH